MKASIAARLAGLDSRLKEIDARLADPEVTLKLAATGAVGVANASFESGPAPAELCPATL